MAVVQHPRPPAARLAPPPRDGTSAARMRPRPTTVVLVPVAVALVVGTWGLRRHGTMWRDEAVTYDMAHRGLSGLARIAPHHDTVHVLYYFLMHGVFGVFGVFGDGLVALRLPSVLGMAAAAGGVAVLGHRLAGPGAGLFAGIVFSLLPDVQRYAQEGRSYGLVCAAVVWATVLFVRATRERRPGPWAGYAVVSLGACLLHEFAVLAVLAHAATLLVTRAPGALLRAWAAAAGCVAAGLAPLAVISTGQTDLVAWIGHPGSGTWLRVAVVAAIALGCAAAVRGPVVSVALPLALVPNAVLLTVSLAEPLYVERYVVYSSAGLALLLGTALQAACRRRTPVRAAAASAAALAALLLVVPVAQQLRTPASRKDDLAAIAAAVHAQAAPGDGLLFAPARRRIWKLPYAAAYRGLTDLALEADPHASHTLYGTELPPPAVRTRMLATRRIVVLQDPAGFPLDRTGAERAKLATLRAHFERCDTTAVRGARITLYARPGAC